MGFLVSCRHGAWHDKVIEFFRCGIGLDNLHMAQVSLARATAVNLYSPHIRWIHPRTQAWWPNVPEFSSRSVCDASYAALS